MAQDSFNHGTGNRVTNLQGSLHLCSYEICALCPDTAAYSVSRLLLTHLGRTHHFFFFFLFQGTVLLQTYFFTSLVLFYCEVLRFCLVLPVLWHSPFAEVS